MDQTHPDGSAGTGGAPDKGPRGPFHRAAIIGLGVGLMLLGLVGLVLPILPGLLLLFIGLSVIALEVAWARRLKDRIRRRFPGRAGQLDQADQRASELADEDG